MNFNSLLKFVFILSFFGATKAFAHLPGGDCLTNESVIVCDADAANLRRDFVVYYSGYLVKAGNDITVAGQINGRTFSEHMGYDTNAENPAERIGSDGRRPTEFSLYFIDAQNRYDSRYGQNYKFHFN